MWILLPITYIFKSKKYVSLSEIFALFNWSSLGYISGICSANSVLSMVNISSRYREVSLNMSMRSNRFDFWRYKWYQFILIKVTSKGGCDTWFRPPLWNLLVLQLLRPDSSNLPCLYSTFHLGYPLVLSRFCSYTLIDLKLDLYDLNNI